MNTRKFIIAVIAFLLPYFAVSQPAIENLLKKHENKSGFQSIIISGEMIKLVIPNLIDNKAQIDSLDLSSIDFSKINGVSILICESNELKEDFIKDIEKAIDKTKYISLLQINNDKDKVKVLATKSNSTLTNILLYHKGVSSGVTLVHVNGSLEEKTITNIINNMMTHGFY
jgi:hypothetical protein